MKTTSSSTKELVLENNTSEAKFAILLTNLSNIRTSGKKIIAQSCPDVLRGEADDFVYGINTAAAAVAHIAAPGDSGRSNRILKAAGLEDLAEDPIED